MKDKKNICKKSSFIDEAFGENNEYVRIYDENGITIIFGMDNKIIIKNFKNQKELIEKYIGKYIENEFTNELLIDQDREINRIKTENKILRDSVENIDTKKENDIICVNLKCMEG